MKNQGLHHLYKFKKSIGSKYALKSKSIKSNNITLTNF